MTRAIIDIETNGFDINGIIHCIGCKLEIDGEPQPTQCFTSHWLPNSDGSLKAFIRTISNCDQLVHHNGMKFDIPYLSTYFNLNFNTSHLDTMLLAKIMFPKEHLIGMDMGIEDFPSALYGSYSLDAFGRRLGLYKGSYDDWSKLTTEMVDYCKQDVEVTYALLTKLESMPSFPATNVIELENSIAAIIGDQERYGFYFDIEAARKLNTSLLFERQKLEFKLSKTFKPRFLPDGKPQKTNKLIRRRQYIPDPSFIKWDPVHQYTRPLKRFKSGKLKLPAKSKYQWFSVPHRLIFVEKNGEFQNIKLTKFTGTDNQIKLWLKALYDFEFNTYTAKGNVKVDRDDLKRLGSYGEDLIKLMKVKKSLSSLSTTDNSWIARFNPITHSIHGKCDTIGAITHRATHTKPNLAQIDADPKYRALFTAPPDFVLLGADLKNIEIRVLAHYLYPYDNGKYAEAVLSKDMHWYHAKVAGFWTKNDCDWDEHTATPEMKAARALSKKFFFG